MQKGLGARIRCLAAALLVCGFIFHPRTDVALSAESGVQIIFVGDRTCADLPDDCRFSAITPGHPYLHVIVNDLPGNQDWQVQAAGDCSAEPQTILGGIAVEPSRYVEGVVDTRSPIISALQAGGSLCLDFRGHNHWAVTFYAAYFDDNPAPDGAQVFPGYQALEGRPDLPDLDVLSIGRTPAYAYDAAKNNPKPGDRVVFTAHVADAGSRTVNPYPFQWLLDGVVIASGAGGALQPGQQQTLTLPWIWKDGPHELELRSSPEGPEVSVGNDGLNIRTDALSLGFWVEQSALHYFQQYQFRYCVFLSCAGSDSFADWLNRQVSAWNGLLESARDPQLAPNGVADRVRLDKIVVVPDGSLPLHGGRATNSPDMSDHTVDLQWGIPAAGVDKAYKRNWEGPFDVDWALIHELGHARYLADYYRFDVPFRDADALHVTDAAGHPVFNPAKPESPENLIQPFTTSPKVSFFYTNREQDLMSCTCTPRYSPYSAVVLNRIQGRRAHCGNFNPPCNIGDWYLDIPPISRLRILNASGLPVQDGSTVRLLFDRGQTYADHAFDDGSSMTLAVHNGTVRLPPDPFRSGGLAWQAAHNILLIEVRSPRRDLVCFQEPTDFNLAYWSGYDNAQTPATFTLQIGRQQQNGCNLQLPVPLVNEPFGASAFDSTVTRMQGRPVQYAVRLVDGSTPGVPMRDRHIRLLDHKGRAIGGGVTNADGEVTLTPRRGARVSAVIDLTDNRLALKLQSAAPPPRAARPR